jgi:hypothetical protein
MSKDKVMNVDNVWGIGVLNEDHATGLVVVLGEQEGDRILIQLSVPDMIKLAEGILRTLDVNEAPPDGVLN